MDRATVAALAALMVVSAPPPSTPESTPTRRHWYSAAPVSELEPITTKRAYTEVLFVFAFFFATGIIAAALILGGRSQDLSGNESWAIDMTQSVAVVLNIAMALVVVYLLCDRRKVRFADLGLSIPRSEDGSLAVSQTVRIAAWAFFAETVGGVVNHFLQSGHLPTQTSSAPQIIFSMFDSLQAGIIEELVVLAFVVVTLRQAGRPLWEITAVALVLRGSYHIYYGPGVFGILLWAAIYYWIYLRTRSLLTLMACHALWDMVAFLGTAAKAVGSVAFGLIFLLWLVAPILWLVERSNRRPQAGMWVTQSAWDTRHWQPGGGWPSQSWPGHDSTSQAWANHDPTPNAWPGHTWPGHTAAPPVTPVPPGWYADPGGQNRWRWWDGGQWTQHLSEPDPDRHP